MVFPLHSVVTPHQSHSTFSCFIPWFPVTLSQTLTPQRSSFWMFLLFSRSCRASTVRDSHGVTLLDFCCWLSTCVYTVLKLLTLLFFALWFVCLFVCLLFLETCLHLHLNFLPKKTPNKNHLVFIYVGPEKTKLVSHVWSRWPGAGRGADSVAAGRVLLGPNQRFQNRLADLDQQNLFRWLGLLCLIAVVWALDVNNCAKLKRHSRPVIAFMGAKLNSWKGRK